jgi:DHA2 family multidrug resistance protein-like MFS transporter
LPYNRVASNAPRPAGLDVVLNIVMFTLIFLGGERLGMHGGPAGSGLPWAGLALLAAGGAVGWVYLRRQWHLATPLFPVDLLRMPVFALSMASSVGAFGAQMLAYLSLPFLLLESYGRTPLRAGLLITCWPLAISAVAPIAGRLIGRYPDGLLGGVGMALFAAGLWLLAALPAQPADLDIAWRLALCGAGFALFQSPNNHTIVTSAPLHRSGAASGMLGTARLTGQTGGAVLLSALFSVWPPSNGTGEKVALVVAGCLAVCAAFTSSRRVAHMPRGHRHDH